jgi:hypothetical protein
MMMHAAFAKQGFLRRVKLEMYVSRAKNVAVDGILL